METVQTQTREQAIAQVKDAFAKGEAEMAALPPSHYVIVWGAAPLKVTNGVISLCGEKILSTESHANALENAARWRDRLVSAGNREAQEKVYVFTARQALVFLRKKNADLLAIIDTYSTQGA